MDSEVTAGNVLVIADAPNVGEDLCRHVLESGAQPMLLAGSEKSLLEKGTDETIDLIVTEMDAGDPASVEVLTRLLDGDVLFGVPQLHVVRDDDLRGRLRELNPDLAAVFLGASPPPDELRTRLRLLAEIGRMRRDILRESVRDELTDLYNRRFMLVRLEQEFSRARRHRAPLSLVLFEVDRMRDLNERQGLDHGDRALRHVANVLRSQTRKEDACGRWSGTCFVALLSGTPHRGAAVFANKVRGEMEDLQLNVSAGISSFDPKRRTDGPAELVSAAEEALLEAKNRGGNRVFIDEAVMQRERRLVIVADPDTRLVDLAEDLLAMDDFSVVRAESEPALLDALASRRPDVLILDLVHLADDSAALTDRIRAMFPDAPVPIVGLASAPGPTIERVARIGVDRYLTKPFSVAVLRSLARDLLEQYRRGGAAGRSV